MRAALGLDRPLHEQYLDYLSGIIRLDLGSSFITNRDVTDDFLQRFPATIELTVAALVFAIGIGIPLGMYTAKRRGPGSTRSGPSCRSSGSASRSSSWG